MAWWDDVLNLLRDEFAVPQAPDAAEPATAKQAESVLKRTGKELASAQARAEAARRRLLRAQDELQKLTQNSQQPNSYRERLTVLAKSVAHESDLVEAFDAHIARLSEVQQRIERTYQRFERDMQMARQAKVTANVTQAINPQAPNPSTTGGESKGFRRARAAAVMDALHKGPKA